MGKNKKLIIALPILLAVVVFVWLPNFNSSTSNSKKSKKGNASNAFKDDDVAALVRELSSIKTAESAPGEWSERNPFNDGSTVKKLIKDKKTTTANTGAVNYSLSGIFWNETKPSVIINDSVYSIGSKIDSLTVTEIRADEVILSDGANENVLKLKKD